MECLHCRIGQLHTQSHVFVRVVSYCLPGILAVSCTETVRNVRHLKVGVFSHLALLTEKYSQTRMWANAQPDGRPAEYR